MNRTTLSLIAGATAMSAAQAQNTPGSAYVGASAVTAKNQTVDAHKADAKLFAGYNFDEKLGVEAGVTNFHKTDFQRAGVNGSTEGYGTYVAAKYTMPVNEQLSAYGKLGVQHSERKLNTTVGNLKDKDSGAYAGLGLQYKLYQSTALVAEYERYGKDKDVGAKADVWSVGVNYGF